MVLNIHSRKLEEAENSAQQWSIETPDRTVEIGLTTGAVKKGELMHFNPKALEFSLKAGNVRNSTTGGVFNLRLASDQVSYIGFLSPRNFPISGLVNELREYEIHVTGEKSFQVRTFPKSIEDPTGFYGWPTDANAVTKEYYFFSKGISLVEEDLLLGDMLVEESLVDSDELEVGLLTQEIQRETPVGQILVEKKILPFEAVEKAAETHKKLQNRGATLRIGEVLIAEGLITLNDLEKALSEQRKRKGKRLGEVLVELGFVSEKAVAETLSRKFHLPFINLDNETIDPRAVGKVSAEFIEKHNLFPYKLDANKLWIATSDPLNMEPFDLLRFSLKMKIQEVVVVPSQLSRFISREQSGNGSAALAGVKMDEILAELDANDGSKGAAGSNKQDYIEASEQDPAITRLVNRVIVDAYRLGASDIHIEPYGKSNDTVVRFRVDGVMSEYQKIPATNRKQVIARVKIMAHLDITERRKPQDGKIRIRIGQQTVELRVATIPTSGDNEDIVLRILAGAGAMALKDMNFSKENLKNLEKLVERPYGLILAVGPTGSGKTTTLHSLVGHINDETRKIWTAEDPVEITQYGLRQVQVKPAIGFTFAAAMRSFLRADPDVVLVGEMRDQETAGIGVEASLTGHLVLSTLHTNSAAETITRLVDMGLEPFSFSDALLGVLAQRLTRRLCPKCKVQHDASEAERHELEEHMGTELLEKQLNGKSLKLWNAPGCEHCKQTGYKGRLALHELLVVDEGVRMAIQKRKTVDEIVHLAREGGMLTLLQDGLEKAIEGLTDVKQVLAVCSK